MILVLFWFGRVWGGAAVRHVSQLNQCILIAFFPAPFGTTPTAAAARVHVTTIAN